MKKLSEPFKILKEEIIKKDIVLSLYLSLLVLLLFNPIEKEKNKVVNFNRTFGEGVLANWDCSILIHNFYFWFILFIISFILILAIVTWISHNSINESNRYVWKRLDMFLNIGFISYIFCALSYLQYTKQTMFDFSLAFISSIIISHVLYCALNVHRYICYTSYYRMELTLLGIAFPIAISLPFDWKQGKTFFILYMTVMLASILIWCLFKRYKKKGIKFPEGIKNFSILFLIIFPCTSLYIEIINVLNQYGIFINYPLVLYGIGIVFIAVLLLAGGFLISHLLKREIKWENYIYLCILTGMVGLAVNPPLISEGLYSINESANYSILISDFLNYGKLPIIEHYGGHMLSMFMGGVSYGLINQDYANAIYSPYSVYIYFLIVILSYYFFKAVFDKELAFWITLILPVYAGLNYWGTGLLLCIALKKYLNDKKKSSAIMMWSLAILVLLYRLDIGIAFLFGLIFALCAQNILYKDKKGFKILLYSGLFTACTALGIFCILCIVKSINPLSRIKEFIGISASNLNWGRDNIGNVSLTVFTWNYFVIPVICIVILTILILLKKARERLGTFLTTLLLLLGFAYLINFSRGLVRHSMVELTLEITIFTAYMFIAIAVGGISKKREVFIVAFFFLIILDSILDGGIAIKERGAIGKAQSNMDTVFDSWKSADETDETLVDWKNLNEKVSRVDVLDSLVNKAVPLKTVMELLGKDGDTWLDFVNYTFLYSVNNYECPVYVSQSPMQLSGENTQEAFIQELDRNISRVPIAIMPNTGISGYGFDGIHNYYRHYKVAEYIFQHYSPLASYQNEFSIWCRNDIYSESFNKLKNYNDGQTIINGITNEIKPDESMLRLIAFNNAKAYFRDDKIYIKSIDPTSAYAANIVNGINLAQLSYGIYNLKIHYEIEEDCEIKLYGINKEGENFPEIDPEVYKIERGTGTLILRVPITNVNAILLEVKGADCFVINGFSWEKTKDEFTFLDWNYDNPYICPQHNYNLGYLPHIWASNDKKDSISNRVLKIALPKENGEYIIENVENGFKRKGNYLLLTCDYKGTDDKDNQETASLNIAVKSTDESVNAYYNYSLTLLEGTHSYLIRVSSDFYWYVYNMNLIEVDYGISSVSNISFKVLAGD